MIEIKNIAKGFDGELVYRSVENCTDGLKMSRINPNLGTQQYNTPSGKTVDLDKYALSSDIGAKCNSKVLKSGKKTSTKRVSKPSSVRSSIAESSNNEKSKKFQTNKEKMTNKKTKRRPGSATEKSRDRKLLKKSIIVAQNPRIYEIENQLDMLFEAGITNNPKLSESSHSESTQTLNNKLTNSNKSSERSPFSFNDLNSFKIPLPPPPLNMEKLMEGVGKCSN